MFYGSFPGNNNALVKETWTNVSFEVKPNANTNDGRMALTFDTRTPDIYISSITLKNLSDKTVRKIYDTSTPDVGTNFYANLKTYTAKHENGVLHINKSTDVRKSGVLVFYLKSIPLKKDVKYLVSLELKYAKQGPILVSMYTLNPHNEIGKSTKPTFLTQQKYAADYGVNFVTLGVPVAWNEKILEIFQKKYYEPLFDALVKNNPNVRIIPRVGVDPPKWWLDKNPDSEMRNYDGQPTTRISNDLVRTVQRFVAVSSEKYQKDADDALRMTISIWNRNTANISRGITPPDNIPANGFIRGVLAIFLTDTTNAR